MGEPFRVGYCRCSTDEQDVEIQTEQLLALGVPRERIFIDKGFSGTTRKNRAGLDNALAAVTSAAAAIDLAWSHLPFRASDLTALGAVRPMAERHSAFLASSEQRPSALATPEALPDEAAAKQVAQPSAAGFGVLPVPVPVAGLPPVPVAGLSGVAGAEPPLAALVSGGVGSGGVGVSGGKVTTPVDDVVGWPSAIGGRSVSCGLFDFTMMMTIAPSSTAPTPTKPKISPLPPPPPPVFRAGGGGTGAAATAMGVG